jgi:hypothetical protein
MQRENIRDRAAGVLLRQGVVPLRQQSFVKGGPKGIYPDRVKVMEDTGVDERPIMNGQGHLSC